LGHGQDAEAAASAERLLALVRKKRRVLAELEAAVQALRGELPSEETHVVRGAVVAGLDWLAAHQEPDGLWKAVEHSGRGSST
jgi:hypothetical protein